MYGKSLEERVLKSGCTSRYLQPVTKPAKTVMTMTRRYSYKYYGFHRSLRSSIVTKIVSPSSNNPYIEASKVYMGTAPVLRLHVRAIDDLLELYEVMRTIQEFFTLAIESVRIYITDILGYSSLSKELADTSRRIALRFNQLIKNDNILGIIIGSHGGIKPSGNRREARRLKPANDLIIDDKIELRTLELGVDIILQPSRIVNKVLRNINHTKIYWTRL